MQRDAEIRKLYENKDPAKDTNRKEETEEKEETKKEDLHEEREIKKTTYI